MNAFKTTKPDVDSMPRGYLLGAIAASRYLGFRDRNCRGFRVFVRKHGVRPAVVGSSLSWRIADLDMAWERARLEAEK